MSTTNTRTLTAEAAQRILKARPVFPALKPGQSKTVKLMVRSVSDIEFDTTLVDAEHGNLLKRKIVNYSATNGARKALPVVQAAIKAQDWVEVLNNTELTGSILEGNKFYDTLSGGTEVNAIITAVEGETAEGADYAGSVVNIKILSVVAPEALSTDASFFDMPEAIAAKPATATTQTEG
jgi:hypothetical protein